jgi:hypothetical protein
MKALGKKKVATILLVLFAFAAAGGVGVWWFAFRKNPESMAKIEQINETQENVDEALGWDDAPAPAPAKPAE